MRAHALVWLTVAPFLTASCSTTGSGGDSPPRTRGMRLPMAQPDARPHTAAPMAPPRVRPRATPPRVAAPSPTAVERLRAALKKRPEDHATRLKLARLLLDTGDVGPAEAELRKLLGVKAQAQAARVLLLRLLRGVYRLDEAVKLGKAHVKAHPKDAEGRKQYGMALLAWRARSMAAAQLKAAVRLAPKRADLWRELGRVYLKWRKLNKAAAALRKAVALDPQNPWPLVLLGDVRWGQSNTKLAEKAYRKAAGLTGGPPVFRAVALDKLGTLLKQLGRRKTARKVYAACVQMFPHLGCPYTRAALLPPNPVRLPAMRPAYGYGPPKKPSR